MTENYEQENENVIWINEYPLQETYDRIDRALDQRIDWRTIIDTARAEKYAAFDVSWVVNLLPHLTLDEEYRLLCYVTYEYHGIWGHVAAIRKGEPAVPTISEDLASQILSGPRLDLPACAVSPMDAIYHDGTIHGMIDALICALYMAQIPYQQFEDRHLTRFITQYPERFFTDYHRYVDIPDWRIRGIIDYKGSVSTIYAIRERIEEGFGVSDGQDRIYLESYSFSRDLRGKELSRALGHDRSARTYPSYIKDNTRYNEERHCCDFSCSSVLIALQKNYREL